MFGSFVVMSEVSDADLEVPSSLIEAYSRVEENSRSSNRSHPERKEMFGSEPTLNDLAPKPMSQEALGVLPAMLCCD